MARDHARTAFPFRVLYSRRSPRIVLPFAPTASRLVLPVGNINPCRDRPANALGANSPAGPSAGVLTLRR